MILLSILIFLILILLVFNFVYFKNKGFGETPQYLKGEDVFCPFLLPSYCKKVVIIPSSLGKEYCFTAKEGTKIVSPIDGEVDYGQVSFGEEIGKGEFLPRLKIAWQGKEVFLILSGKPKENLPYVKAGEEIAVISKRKLQERGHLCNLILLIKSK